MRYRVEFTVNIRRYCIVEATDEWEAEQMVENERAGREHDISSELADQPFEVTVLP